MKKNKKWMSNNKIKKKHKNKKNVDMGQKGFMFQIYTKCIKAIYL